MTKAEQNQDLCVELGRDNSNSVNPINELKIEAKDIKYQLIKESEALNVAHSKADALSHELNSIYNSKSWKITSPLRELNFLRHTLLKKLYSFLRPRFILITQRMGCYRFFRSLYLRFSGSFSSTSPILSELELNPKAQRVLEELKIAMNKDNT